MFRFIAVFVINQWEGFNLIAELYFAKSLLNTKHELSFLWRKHYDKIMEINLLFLLNSSIYKVFEVQNEIGWKKVWEYIYFKECPLQNNWAEYAYSKSEEGYEFILHRDISYSSRAIYC